MKSCITKTAVLALAVSLFSLLGCETVVTDVNAELAAIYPEEDLGIPVKLNENYIEVAYNPASTSADEVSDDIEDDTDVKETVIKDYMQSNKLRFIMIYRMEECRVPGYVVFMNDINSASRPSESDMSDLLYFSRMMELISRTR